MTAPLIRLEDIGVSYGNPLRPVLSGINLEIAQGEFLCVLGQTGCGKSTLLRLILGSERPTRGRVLVDGVEHDRPDRSRGYVPQRYSLFPDKTVLDNITFGAEVGEFGPLGCLTPRYYRRRREFRAQATDYLRRIGLSEADGRKYPDQLSGGMQQRVAIAQSLMTDPRILLMDEAFSALDPGTRGDMQKLIRSLWQSTGTTILFVTHNPREALLLGTRVVALAKAASDGGSRVILDQQLPEQKTEAEMVPLTSRLESVFQSPDVARALVPAVSRLVSTLAER